MLVLGVVECVVDGPWISRLVSLPFPLGSLHRVSLDRTMLLVFCRLGNGS